MAMHRYKEPIIKACVMCGNYMEAYSPNQKYCEECALLRKNKSAEAYRSFHKRVKPKAAPKISIDEMCKLTDKYGISYGKVELMLRKEGA